MNMVNRYYYEDGNAVRINEPLPTLEERRRAERERKRHEEHRNNLKKRSLLKANQLKAFFSIFLVCLISLLIGSYLFMQLKTQQCNREIASLEAEISDLKADNTSNTNRINAQANLDAVKDAAASMGMTYATSDKIMYYDVDEDDYMYQYKDMP